jgi:hypothetical protein
LALLASAITPDGQLYLLGELIYMKMSLSKRFIIYPLATSMLMVNFAYAMPGAGVGSPNPCQKIIELETQQIKIMDKVKNNVATDKVLGTVGSTAGSVIMAGEAATSGKNALQAAASGDYATAAIEGFLALLNGASAYKAGKDAVETGKEGIKETLNSKSELNERKARLAQLQAQPGLCTAEVKIAYTKTYLQESKSLNNMYINYINELVAKADAKENTIISGTSTLIFGIAFYASIGYMQKSGGNFFPLAISTLGLAVSGVYFGQDLLYDLPRLNALKAYRSALQKVNAEADAILAGLN